MNALIAFLIIITIIFLNSVNRVILAVLPVQAVILSIIALPVRMKLLHLELNLLIPVYVRMDISMILLY